MMIAKTKNHKSCEQWEINNLLPEISRKKMWEILFWIDWNFLKIVGENYLSN
jgi:hypothetical protein